MKNIKTIIVSPGGVGTTFIMEFFSGFCDINCIHDSDGLKHVNNPIYLSKFENAKALVIIGKPSDIALSLSRRKILREQLIKLNKRSYRRIILKIIGFSSYMKLFNDPLGYEKFMRNWIHADGIERLIVKYESIYKHEQNIKDFLLGEIQTEIDTFPPQKNRNIKSNSNHHDSIKRKYHDLDYYYESLNDLIRVAPTTHSNTSKLRLRIINSVVIVLKKIF